MSHKWVKDIDSLYNFIGYVVLRAPDRFPVEDFLKENEQMNLEKAFQELRYGIDLVKKDFPSVDENQKLSNILERSHKSYLEGNDRNGAHLLQEFENCIFKQ